MHLLIPVPPVCETNSLWQLKRYRLRLRFRHAPELNRREGNVTQIGHMRKQRLVLRHHANILAQFCHFATIMGVGRDVTKRNGAFSRYFQIVHAANKSGFAKTTRPVNRHYFAAVHITPHAPYDFKRAKVLAQSLDRKKRFISMPPSELRPRDLRAPDRYDRAIP